MACSKPSKDYLANEIRIALVGKMGVGKSSTGNTILGDKKFKSKPSLTSVTKFCEHASLERFGRNLQVVDVPGLQDKHCAKEKLHQQVTQCVTLLSPGIHAILFVIRIGRYSEEDVKSVKDFIKIFGPKSKDFVIVVFTGEDDLDEDFDLQTFIQDPEVSLKTFLREVNNRYISVNNKGTAEQKNQFVERLIKAIEQLLRDNKRTYYTCDMLDSAEEHVKKLEDQRANEIEAKNKERDKRVFEEAIAEYKAQLAKEKVSKEEETKLIEEKKNDINIRIDTEHHLEARNEIRVEMSETIKKNDTSLGAAMTTGAAVGAAAGAFAGPVGAALGSVAGATWGAICSLWG